MQTMSESEIMNVFESWALDRQQRKYLAFHARRYSSLLHLVGGLVAPGARLLDVGPAFQTHLFRRMLGDSDVFTLGFPSGHGCDVRCDIPCDLNAPDVRTGYDKRNSFDAVVVAEVIEHLTVPPHMVLAFLSGFMKSTGVLVVTTPNAVDLAKRVRFLRGDNPFEMLRETRSDPGHFREYTLGELRAIGKRAGLTVVEEHVASPWRSGKLTGRMLWSLSLVMPPTLRQAISIVYRVGGDKQVADSVSGVQVSGLL